MTARVFPSRTASALDKSDYGAAMDYRERLCRWAFPLAQWYLEKAKD